MIDEQLARLYSPLIIFSQSIANEFVRIERFTLTVFVIDTFVSCAVFILGLFLQTLLWLENYTKMEILGFFFLIKKLLRTAVCSNF